MSQTVDQKCQPSSADDDAAPAVADTLTPRRRSRLPWRKTAPAHDDTDCAVEIALATDDEDGRGSDSPGQSEDLHGDHGSEADEHGSDSEGEGTEAGAAAKVSTQRPAHRLIGLIALIVVVTMTVLCGWLGVRGYEVSQQLREREAFVQGAREGAVMLTTIDAAHVQDDAARIVASSTGRFLEDFQQRSQAFVDTVVKVQSKTQGTVLAAGLQSVDGDQAEVLVTMSVKTSINGAETQPRQWRMRIGVQRDGSTVKVSNVEFVP